MYQEQYMFPAIFHYANDGISIKLDVFHADLLMMNQ